MRKKFVKVMLFGALVFSTTVSFVGCADYDDDINKLQEQVDALKSISISDLASQLQSLKDANGNLAIASAKMEAAIAEIKANIEALKEVDKTLTSLVNGKVDQATYQAAIDGLNAKCSDLSAKVAALSALEAAVNDLKANKADKATMEALQTAIKALEAKDTELATQLASLKSTVEGLNSVLAGKADKTTVDALKESIDALKISVNGIDAKLSKALEPIQASIAKLQEDLAKKADAATIAADIAKVKSDMTAVTDALKAETAANLAGVKAELAGRIAALETAKGQMEVQVGKLQSDLGALKDRVTALENKPTTDLNEVKAAIAANKTAIESAQATIGGIQGTIKGITDRLDGIGAETGAVKTYIDAAISGLNTTISGKIETSITAAVSRLIKEYEQADADLAKRLETLEGIAHVKKTDFDNLQRDFNSLKNTVDNAETGLIKQLNDLNAKVGSLISDAIAANGPGTIADAIAKQINTALSSGDLLKDAIDTAISGLTGRVDKIKADLDAVLERIQSIVFVPQYKDASNGTSIVPVYRIDNKNGFVEMVFRISPAEKAKELAVLGAAKPEIFSFYKEDELQSRSTNVSALTAVEVRAGSNSGTIVIKAQISNNLGGSTTGIYYPVALKLATSKDFGTAEAPNSKPVNDITTEYFNVRVKNHDVLDYVSSFSEDIIYTDIQEKPVNSFSVKTTALPSLSLDNCGFTQNLELYTIECGANNWVKVSSTVKADKDAIAAELKDKGFELVGKTAVKLSSPININNVDKTLKVQLTDNNIFGLTGTPAAPAKIFEVTYTVTKNTVGATIDYAAITKASLQTGSSSAFVENTAGEFVWKNNASNGTQTFIIKADKAAKFTDQLIDGATSAEILTAIKNLASANIIHKIGNATATASDPTFKFDVDNDKVTVTLPAGALHKTYAMSTVYKTDTYGDIVLKATLKLTYPTAADLWAHDGLRWVNPTTYFLEYTPPANTVEDAAYAAYDISDNLKAGFITKNSNVNYSYELVKTIDTNRDGVMDAVPDGVTITSAGVIVFTKYVDLQYVKVKFAANIGTNVAAYEEFAIQMTYPITDRIASKSYTYTKAEMLADTPLDIVTGLNLKDRFGKTTSDVVKDGKIEKYGTEVYRMTTGSAPTLTGGKVFKVTKGVRYTIKDGKVEGSSNPLSANEYFDISDKGKFSLKKNINLAKKVTIEVQAAVDYTYGTVTSNVFTITLEPTN